MAYPGKTGAPCNLQKEKEKMEDITTAINWLWSLAGVKFLVTHTLINTFVAVAAAQHSGNFKLHKLFEFLWRTMLPLVLVYGAVEAIGVDAGLEALAPVVLVMLETALAANLAENLAVLGVPIPERALSMLGKTRG